jgi:hypothetical protein
MSAAEKARTANQELESEYLEWVNRYLSAHAERTQIEHRRSPVTHYFFKGYGSTLSLFPHTSHHFAQFHDRYVFHGDAREKDWYNVGADLYQAILGYRIGNCDRARHPAETEPTDPVCTR